MTFYFSKPCDAEDGVKDAIISMPFPCHPNLADLKCSRAAVKTGLSSIKR
jgi:hypothetical protein